jgi:hypothetical protein
VPPKGIAGLPAAILGLLPGPVSAPAAKAESANTNANQTIFILQMMH